MFQEKLQRLAETCKLIEAPDWLYRELSEPKNIIRYKIRTVVKGVLTPATVIRVQYCNPHSTGARPYKGGIRFHPGVTGDLMKVLSFDMTKKTALAELPFGGAKGGIAIDPAAYTSRELRYITEEMARALYATGGLGPDIDVPGPDVGTNSETMFWMYNKMAILNAEAGLNIPNVAAVVTGKPLDSDGCPGREEATAHGGLITLREYLRLTQNLTSVNTTRAISNERPTLAIQGFGNVGANLMKLISDPTMGFDFKVIAVSDVDGGIYVPDGIDFQKLHTWYTSNGTMKGFPGADYITNKEVLTMNCDVLIPAAIENQITIKNAPKIEAKMIIELANEAITSEAYDILKDRGLPTIPGVAANSGGVIVSFMEWALNRGARWHKTDRDEIYTRVVNELNKIMTNVIQRVVTRTDNGGLSLEEAADVLAIETLRDQLKIKHSY